MDHVAGNHRPGLTVRLHCQVARGRHLDGDPLEEAIRQLDPDPGPHRDTVGPELVRLSGQADIRSQVGHPRFEVDQ